MVSEAPIKVRRIAYILLGLVLTMNVPQQITLTRTHPTLSLLDW